MKLLSEITNNLVINNREDSSEKYKEYRNSWVDNVSNEIVNAVPIHLDLDIHTGCNLKCIMCPQTLKPKIETMSKDMIFDSIIEFALKGGSSIKLQYRGEPLLDKRLDEIIKYCKHNEITEVMINSNGNLLTEDIAEKLINAGLDKIIISMDSCDKDTYEKIRVGADFDKVVKNIKCLKKIRDSNNSDIPIIRMQAVIMKENEKQKKDYIEFWHDIADQISFNTCIDLFDTSEVNIPLPEFKCGQLWQRIFIVPDGTVLPCCRAVEGWDDWLYTIGNINEQSIEQIWNSDKINFLRDLHSKGESHKIEMCRKCAVRKLIIKEKT